jgi:hypothetical protein
MTDAQRDSGVVFYARILETNSSRELVLDDFVEGAFDLATEAA